MIKLIRTNAQNYDFVALVKDLDAELTVRDGCDHEFYDQYNKIDMINHVVIGYRHEMPVACGAFKEHEPSVAEIKRMFTNPAYRGKGFASEILKELETWAFELNYNKCILETSIRLPEAIGLYQKHGYRLIPNYGQYMDAADSRCFEKQL